jgi:cytochrome d ubiquinol oxidase subunit II
VIAALLTIAATAFVGAAFLSAGARRFAAADLVGYFRLRAWCSLLVIAALAVVGLAVTHDDARYVHDGLTSGSGLVLVLAAVACAVLTAGLLYRGETGWARFTAVGSVALVVVAWGLARRPYLIPTSLTVSQAADASATSRWLMLVTLVAVLLVGAPLFLLYRLDTWGALKPLAEADLRQTSDGREPESRSPGTGPDKARRSCWSWACPAPGRPPSARRSPSCSECCSSRATTSNPPRTSPR